MRSSCGVGAIEYPRTAPAKSAKNAVEWSAAREVAMGGATALRSLLGAEAMVIAPGAYDGLAAKLVAQAGFPAVYMTGAGTSVSQGYPDFGLLTMSEMVENAARIVRAVDVPVIADADTGYGNELNVFRTVQE